MDSTANSNGDLDSSRHVKKEELDLNLDGEDDEEEDVDMEDTAEEETSSAVVKKKEEEDVTMKNEEVTAGGNATKSLLLDVNEEEEEEEEDDEPVMILSTQPPIGQEQQDEEDENLVLTNELIKDIVTPSPFAHHNTSDRYRNALLRVQSNPTRDIEAWQVIMNECTQCYRTHVLPLLRPTTTPNTTATSTLNNPLWMRKYGSAATAQHPQLQQHQNNLQQSAQGTDSSSSKQKDLNRKLEWAESCYGNLLQYFPYASGYYVGVVDMLIACTTLPSDVANLSKQHNWNLTSSSEKELTKRQQIWESKMERIFQFTLGVHMDGTEATPDTSSDENINALEYGMCTSCVDLWLFYIEKCARNTFRSMQKQISSNQTTPATASATIRETIINAYETALSHGGSFVVNNRTLWKQYLEYVQSLTSTSSNADNTTATGEDIHALQQLQMTTLRSVYQRIVTLPMTGLDSLYMEYEAHERQQSEALAAALIAEYQPKYQHARSVYLERARIYNIHELRVGRLPTPPIDPKLDSTGTTTNINLTSTNVVTSTTATGTATSTSGSSLTTATTTAATAGPTGVGMVGTDTTVATNDSDLLGAKKMNVNGIHEEDTSTISWLALVSNEEYKAKLAEEAMILTKWKRRCAYERTNPERLTPAELTQRVRQSYKDAICAFMRHVEVWHEWCTWELFNPNETNKRKKVNMSLHVLSLAQSHLPDCTLLAWSKCQTVQLFWSPSPSKSTTDATTNPSENTQNNTANNNNYNTNMRKEEGKDVTKDEQEIKGIESTGEKAIQIMQDFCSQSYGNTLSYVLLQRLVRKYKGVKEARAIFAQARRSLRIKRHDYVYDATAATATTNTNNVVDTASTNAATSLNATTPVVGVNSQSSNSIRDPTANEGSTGRVVVNRPTKNQSNVVSKKEHENEKKQNKGFITWHLYAAHAEMEYLLNGLPDVAIRVYELGLRKHRSFLSTPPYVLQYANLLLRLGDTDKTRTLLIRAIAAVNEEDGGLEDSMNSNNNNNDPIMSASRVAKREAQRPLWDILMKLQSISSFSNCGTAHSMSAFQSIESRRRKALFGMAMEDVAGIGTSLDDKTNNAENNTITNSKLMALSDSLYRVDGYDVSSRIAHGLDRIVDSLEITGLLRGTCSNAWSFASVTAMSAGLWNNDSHDDEAGGQSDASFVRRMRYQRASQALNLALTASGNNNANSTSAMMMAGAGGTSSSAGTSANVTTGAGKFYNAAASRFMMNNNPAAAAAQQQQQQQIQAAIQSSPEWLRGLLVLLPLHQQRRGGTATPILSTKPPPHMIEMALTALRKNDLPSVRPVDSTTKSSNSTAINAAINNNAFVAGNKRKMLDNGQGDSSDEEGVNKMGNNIGVGGYGAQFRSRQRARLLTTTPSLSSSGNASSNADNE